MDTPPPSITEMEIDKTEATFSPFTFEEIKTFDQPWLEILDMDEFNSIVTDKSEIATLGDIPEHNIDTPADDSTHAGVTTSKLVACTVCKKKCSTDYLVLVHKLVAHNGCNYMCPDYDCRNNIRKLYKSKQGLSNHVLNMHSGLAESVKGNILKEYYGKVSTESNKICIYSVMRTERGGYELSMVESDDESCGLGNGSESDSVLGEVDDGTESVSTLSVASNKFKVHGKRKKKEPPGYCEACNKQLSRKSNVSRHWRNSCPKNRKRKQCRTKGETDLPGK